MKFEDVLINEILFVRAPVSSFMAFIRMVKMILIDASDHYRLRRAAAVLWIVAVFMLPGGGVADDFTVRPGIDLIQSMSVNEGFYDEDTGDFNLDEIYTVLTAVPSLEYEKSPKLYGRFAVNLEWFHEWKTGDDDMDAILSEAFIRYTGERASAGGGFKTRNFGEGLIHYKEEPGVLLDLDVDDRSVLGFEMAVVEDRSPLGRIRFAYRTGFLEEIEVFAAGFIDRDDCAADVLTFFPRVPGEKAPESSGTLFWFGLKAEQFFGRFLLSGIALYEYGKLEISRTIQTPRFSLRRTDKADVQAWAVDFGLSYPLTDNLFVEAFLYGESGDALSPSNTVNAFISVTPYHQRTDIFFSGGVEPYDTETLFVRQIVQYGVLCPGADVQYEVSDKKRIKLTGAVFFPESNPPEDGRYYGWEADAAYDWEFHDDAFLSLYGSFFRYGDIIKGPSGDRPGDAWRLGMFFLLESDFFRAVFPFSGFNVIDGR